MSSGAGFDVYDLDQILALFFGQRISEGAGITSAGEGGFLKIHQDGPSFLVKKGVAGRLVRSKTNEPYSIVEVHLLQTSSKNVVFSTMWNTDIAAPNGAGIGTCQIADLQGTTFFSAQRCWVVAPPDRELTQEQKDVVWLVGCALVDRLDGGN